MKKKTLKCRNCKKQHTPFNGLDNWCKELDCQTAKAMHLLDQKKKKEKEKIDKRFEKMKLEVKTPGRKVQLQKEVNKLSRLIDSRFGFLCIDCGKNFGKQTDAAHLHNSKGNENIRYNLHNLHSARSDCNQYSSEHKVGYRKGIKERYGERYLEYIVYKIPLEFKRISLFDTEVVEKLALVRKLIRDFDTFQLTSSISARIMFNRLIGIYKSDIGEIDLIDDRFEKEKDNLF